MLLSANNAGWFIIIGSASFLVLLIFFFLLFFQYSKRRILHTQEMFSLQKNFEEALLRSQLEIQEQTFLYISQEIHDNIGQTLSLVRLNLNTLGWVENPGKVLVTDELLETAIGDLRNLSHSLNAAYIQELGLVKAVEKTLNALSKSGVFKTELQSCVSYFQLTENQLIIVFRIIQEVLNNIVRHADASSVCVTIEGNENLRRIIISDNGKGFNVTSLSTGQQGIGIRNILTRAKMIGADVSFESVPSKGTNVIISFQLV
jgi:signal transduction histidine kinase